MKFNIKLIYSICLFIYTITAISQQRVDTLFQIDIQEPRYSENNSPFIAIDAMHNNLHKAEGNFAPFANLAIKDGYTVSGLNNYDELKNTDILVIANSIHNKNIGNWRRPIYDAFEDEEIDIIVDYVSQGGSLLLIADHMPFADASGSLAKAFGFEFCGGFAQLAEKENGRDAFSKFNNRLPKSPIVDGSTGKEISKIYTFTGSSFSIPEGAIGILKFQRDDICLQPEIAWQFNEETPKVDITSDYQGAIMNFGKGKIAVFGEAAMFTAQSILQNGNSFRVGFNSNYATENIEFIRNILYWLSTDK